ncbi:MAG: hypothetical protein IPL33_04590 [Sphingobacteriales bacterium]|nr:hypothetical protein [Sphingobacteriales bacterium]
MESYYGQIKLGDIVNTGDNAKDIGLLTARFVHYPDCQQLIVWLPEYGGRGYGTLRLVAQGTDTVVEQSLLAERINGSVQILWDTLPLAPDRYLLEIEHPKGGKASFVFRQICRHRPSHQRTSTCDSSFAASPIVLTNTTHLLAAFIAMASATNWSNKIWFCAKKPCYNCKSIFRAALSLMVLIGRAQSSISKAISALNFTTKCMAAITILALIYRPKANGSSAPICPYIGGKTSSNL